MSKIHFHKGAPTLQLFYNQRVYTPISYGLFLLFLYLIDYQRTVASFGHVKKYTGQVLVKMFHFNTIPESW